jgi:hypothetical protein
MNAIIVKVLLTLLSEIPALTADFEAIAKEAQSSDEAAQKMKVIVADVIKLLTVLSGAL